MIDFWITESKSLILLQICGSGMFFFNYGFLNLEYIFLFLLRIGRSGMLFLNDECECELHILHYGLVDPKFYQKYQSKFFMDSIIHNAKK